MKTLGKFMVAAFAMIVMISTASSAQDSTNGKTAVVKIKTSAVCASCKDRIEKNLAYEKGVTDVVVDSKHKRSLPSLTKLLKQTLIN